MAKKILVVFLLFITLKKSYSNANSIADTIGNAFITENTSKPQSYLKDKQQQDSLIQCILESLQLGLRPPSNIREYQYEKYQNINILVDTNLLKYSSFKNIIQQLDAKTPFISFFSMEDYLKGYIKNNYPKRKREIPIAIKTSYNKRNIFFESYLSDLYRNIELNHKYIELFRHQFNNPLSLKAAKYYNYTIEELNLDQVEYYKLGFNPKKLKRQGFYGYALIDKKYYSLKKIELLLGEENNINFTKTIKLSSSFTTTDPSFQLPLKVNTRVELSPQFSSNTKAILEKETQYKNYQFYNTTNKNSFYFMPNRYKPKVYEQAESIWDSLRGRKLKPEEIQLQKLIKQKKSNFIGSLSQKIASSLITGYFPLPIGIDIGPIFHIYRSSFLEGTRLQIGGRTRLSPSDSWRLSGYIAKGIETGEFEDNEMKYSISLKIKPWEKYSTIIGGRYYRDIRQWGGVLINPFLRFEFNPIMSRKNKPNDKVNPSSHFHLFTSFQAFYNTELKVQAERTYIESTPYFSVEHQNHGSLKQTVEDVNINASITLFPDGRKVGYGIGKRYTRSSPKAIMLKYTRGIASENSYNYNKLQLFSIYPFLIRHYGELIAILNIGKVFNSLPLPLLYPIAANQSYYKRSEAFDLLNFYEFVTDSYMNLQLEHHFKGYLLGNIPYINQSKIRLLTTLSIAYGSLSEANRVKNKPSGAYRSPEIPYFEYGLGIENILGLLRIDAIQRGNYLQNEDTKKFIVKFSFFFRL